ncbi:hypothetical protein EDB83DRAFT_1410251 [Lactarius deliciosus]|nr:hypothetical protein EDB83DRAFT_1410251 [Lactarius deliciosus]
MEYRFDPSVSKPGAAPALTAAAAAQLQVQVPFTLRASLSITDHGGAFELSFTPRGGALEDVAVELYLGSSATGATCSAASGGGEWMYVPGRRTLRRSLAPSAIPGATRSGSGPGRSATLRGTFASGDAHPRPACAAQISFALPAGALLSALKIDQLMLSISRTRACVGVRWGASSGGSNGNEHKTHGSPERERESERAPPPTTNYSSWTRSGLVRQEFEMGCWTWKTRTTKA